MTGFVDNIERSTEKNRDFRQVIFTGPKLQLVLMSIPPGEEIGEEVHEHADQFFRVEEGQGAVRMDGRDRDIGAGTAIVVPAGTKHNIVNTGAKALKLYTVYAPPQHADGTVHHTKADADAEEHVGS